MSTLSDEALYALAAKNDVYLKHVGNILKEACLEHPIYKECVAKFANLGVTIDGVQIALGFIREQ